MIQLFIVSALSGLLLAALVGIFIAMKIQFRALARLQVQQEAWQRAQEAHQRTWEVRQGRHAFDVEKKLSRQVQQVEETWQTWEVGDQERVETMMQEFQALVGKLNLEHELAKLPYNDETPLLSNEDGQGRQPFKNWRPPAFCGTDLSGRDLSNRYLVRADFREARLTGTNFYMADLRGACLTGADLTDADLSGANLSGADLRSTILKGANLLVADIHNAILNGANLRGVRNLTAEQAYSAIFDNATRFDADFDVTLPRIPSIRFTVYTESTPLVSLQSSQIVKQLEAPRNTVEAASTTTPPQVAEELEMVPSQSLSPTDLSDIPQESVTQESEMVAPASLLPTDLPDAPTGPPQDTSEVVLPESLGTGELIEQPEITEDADWAVPEVTDFANGTSENHTKNGASTNGTSSIVPDLISLIEQQVEDTPLTPPPSNGISHTPMQTHPRSDKQGDRHTGEAGKGTHRKGQSGRRRGARPN